MRRGEEGEWRGDRRLGVSCEGTCAAAVPAPRPPPPRPPPPAPPPPQLGELSEIKDAFNIDISNPVVVMDQELSKRFITGKPSDFYEYFMQATMLKVGMPGRGGGRLSRWLP